MDAQIPKIIHYVWVGGKPLTPLANRCIESWKKYAPDYTVRFWHEENIPMDHPYVHEMYQQKKWAFVSDYVRFWALEREGGVYLDTDMELLQPIDQFLTEVAFLGRSKNGDVESSIIGAVPGHSLIAAIRSWYDTDTQHSTALTSPRVIAQNLAVSRKRGDIKIFDYSFFHPCNEGEYCAPEMLARAYGRHH